MDFKDFESTKDDEAVEVQFTIPTFPGQKSDNSPKIHMASLMFLSFLQLKSGHEFALPPHHASPVTIKGDSRVSREFSTTVFTSSE